MKVASVELYRDGEVSPMVSKTHIEEVRGHVRIEWTPHHVVFVMKDSGIIAYKADRVHEIVEHFEEEK
jgi:hypothetical protein